jgi:acetoin utilization protein AcuC
MKPVRLLLTAELIKAYGITKSPNCGILEPRLATDEELMLVHDRAYIDKVKELSQPGGQDVVAAGWGLGTGDNPVFPRMHEAAATITGASLLAAEKIAAGGLDHAFNLAGGLHHAQRARASGFCIYNDVAVAIAWLRRHHGLRVVYLDIDAHHGDGVQNAFYADPEVMTISFHESGRSLFPGTGFTNEAGEGKARGTAVNLPLAPYTDDDVYLEAFDALVPTLVGAFRPDVIVTQNGCDGHWDDPLTHLSLTIGGYGKLWERMHALAHEFAGGRWLAAGGGGYQAFLVVPRAWTLLMAEMAEAELPDELPESWRELCARRGGPVMPELLAADDPPQIDTGIREAARSAMLDGVAEIREKVFPGLGL